MHVTRTDRPICCSKILFTLKLSIHPSINLLLHHKGSTHYIYVHTQNYNTFFMWYILNTDDNLVSLFTELIPTTECLNIGYFRFKISFTLFKN